MNCNKKDKVFHKLFDISLNGSDNAFSAPKQLISLVITNVASSPDHVIINNIIDLAPGESYEFTNPIGGVDTGNYYWAWVGTSDITNKLFFDAFMYKEEQELNGLI